MSAKRYFYVMLAAFGLSIFAGGALLYYSNTVLKDRSSSLMTLKLESIKLEKQQEAFKVAEADVEKYQYLQDIIDSALPSDKDQARSVREIFLMANKSGIKIKSIQFPSSTLGAVKSETVPSSATANVISQSKPVEGLKGVYSLEAIVTPYADGDQYKVTYTQLVGFLKRIESNRRAMQVANIQLAPLGQNSSDSISFTLTINIFIKP